MIHVADRAITMAMGIGAAFTRQGNDLAVGAMGMVVMVLINGQGFDRAGAEQAPVFRIGGNRLRCSGAAYVAVQAEHPVRFRHHEMQIVRHQQHAAAQFIANVANQFIKCHLTGEIDALYRFVQYQKIGFSQDRPGHQDTLELAAG